MSLGEIIRERRRQLGMTQDQVVAEAGISKPYLSTIESGKAKNPPTDKVLSALEHVLQFNEGDLTRLAHMVRTPMDVRQEQELLVAQVEKLRGVVKALLFGTKGAQRKNGEGQVPNLDRLAAQIVEPQGEADSGRQFEIAAGVLVPVINKVAAGYPHHFTDLDYPPSVADEYIRCPDIHDPHAFGARVVGESMEPEYHEGDVVIFSPDTPAASGDDCFVRFEADGGTTFKRFYQDQEGAIRLQPLNNKFPAQTYPRETVTGLWPAVYRFQRVLRR